MHSDVLKFILDHGKYGIGFRVSWFRLGLLDHFAVGCILFMSCAPGQARTTDLSLWIYWLSWYWTMRSARTEGCWLNVSVLKNDCCDHEFAAPSWRPFDKRCRHHTNSSNAGANSLLVARTRAWSTLHEAQGWSRHSELLVCAQTFTAPPPRACACALRATCVQQHAVAHVYLFM